MTGIGKRRETGVTQITFPKAGRLPHVISLGCRPRDAELCVLEVAFWVASSDQVRETIIDWAVKEFKLRSTVAQASTNAMGN